MRRLANAGGTSTEMGQFLIRNSGVASGLAAFCMKKKIADTQFRRFYPEPRSVRRHTERKSRLAAVGLHIDFAAMRLGDLARDVQTKP